MTTPSQQRVDARAAQALEAGLEAASDFVNSELNPWFVQMVTNAVLAALAQADETGAGEPERYRHRKRGTTYRFLGWAQVQAPDDFPLTDYEVVAVYQSEKSDWTTNLGDNAGDLWVRRKTEFEDSRFERLPPASADMTGGAP